MAWEFGSIGLINVPAADGFLVSSVAPLNNTPAPILDFAVTTFNVEPIPSDTNVFVEARLRYTWLTTPIGRGRKFRTDENNFYYPALEVVYSDIDGYETFYGEYRNKEGYFETVHYVIDVDGFTSGFRKFSTSDFGAVSVNGGYYANQIRVYGTQGSQVRLDWELRALGIGSLGSFVVLTWSTRVG